MPEAAFPPYFQIAARKYFVRHQVPVPVRVPLLCQSGIYGLQIVKGGIQYDNILSNMERIADQCSDLGLAVIALTKSSIFGQEHQYIQDVHRDLDQKEHEMYQKEYERYFGILDKNDRMKQEA